MLLCAYFKNVPRIERTRNIAFRCTFYYYSDARWNKLVKWKSKRHIYLSRIFPFIESIRFYGHLRLHRVIHPVDQVTFKRSEESYEIQTIQKRMVVNFIPAQSSYVQSDEGHILQDPMKTGSALSLYASRYSRVFVCTREELIYK